MKLTFDEWLELFPWESETQKKGFLAFYQWYRRLSPVLRDDNRKLAAIVAWFVQKEHESNEWWTETIGSQLTALRDEIRRLQTELAELKSKP